MKTALICGVSGQDGAYLSRLLLEKGYRVIGTSRDASASTFQNLRRLSILDHVELASMTLTDFRSAIQTLSKYMPDEVYNLAGQTSVALSFEQPMEAVESIAVGTLNLLESLRFLGAPTRLYNASSGECFGDIGSDKASEETPFRPRSPYAVAKAAAHWAVVNYRLAYGIFAANGILFNHESPLRAERFISRKIVAAANRIKGGTQQKLKLGNLAIRRDWGWAPEYTEVMWRIVQCPAAEDFVIATGRSNSLEEFVESAFREHGLNWRDHVEIDQGLFRPSEILNSAADCTKAFCRLGWRPSYGMHDVIRMMTVAEAGAHESQALDRPAAPARVP
jgi:GDPmannose 4,6-dehydratase